MSRPRLVIRIKKNPDGSAALTCTRADGTATWQRHTGARGQFFPFHDLTHFAVETTLGHGRGFYGLVADGWDLSDFGSSSAKGLLPADMDPSELIVGFLDREGDGAEAMDAEAFNEAAATYYRLHELPGTPPTITDEQLEHLRAVRGELFARWYEVEPGQALELDFDVPGR